MEKDVMAGKQTIRNRYLNYRNSLTLAERKEKSRRIWEQLKTLEAYQRAQAILVYMDYRSEVMTTGLVEELFALQECGGGKDICPKRIYAPKVEGLDIRFYEVTCMEEFQVGYQGIREPGADAERLFTSRTKQEMDCLILVPGAAFDREGGRMGYGKGFYDRFLAEYPAISSAALAYECQIARKVPVENHDIRADWIITEREVICASKAE